MPWVEGQEGLELLRGVVELGFAVIGLPDQEARAWRVGGIRVPRDDLPEPGAGLFVPAPVQLLLADLIQLFRRKDRRGAGLEPSAAAQEEKERRQAERRNATGVSAHEKSPLHIPAAVDKSQVETGISRLTCQWRRRI